jgi:hypothetical protein
MRKSIRLLRTGDENLVPTGANPGIGNQIGTLGFMGWRLWRSAKEPSLIVSLALAFPLESKVTEFAFNEHVAPV